jgi:hypothetical protein
LITLSLALYSYYKLESIKLTWGGPEQKEAEIAAGNEDAVDWWMKPKKILE